MLEAKTKTIRFHIFDSSAYQLTDPSINNVTHLYEFLLANQRRPNNVPVLPAANGVARQAMKGRIIKVILLSGGYDRDRVEM